MKRREWIFAAAGLLTGVLLLLAWLSPRVTGRGPEAVTLSAWQPITLDLNRPVRPESLAGRFRLSPPVAGQLLIEGQAITFLPSEALEYGRTYTATLRAGASGANRLPMLRGAEWRFEVQPPRLLYLSAHNGVSDLWLVDGRDQAAPARRLTNEAFGVWDYSPLSDGSGVIYSALDEDGSSDLVMVTGAGDAERLLDCDATMCRSPAGQPGGRLVAYERQPLDGGLAATELWLLDITSGETQPAPVPNDLVAAGFGAPLGRYPRWSSDGRLLAAYRPDANLIVVQDLSAEEPVEPVTIPANLETMAGWSPGGRTLAYTELTQGQTEPHDHVDEAGNVISHTRSSLYNHVVVADIDAGQVTDLSAGLEVEEGRPAWHPDGRQLAIPRTITGAGRQLWLVSTDGGEASQLTNDPFFDHTALAWSPDGRSLAFMRVPRADGAGRPTLMVLDLESGQIRPVAEGGFMPAWWP